MRNKSDGKKALLWGFFKLIEDQTYGCIVCNPEESQVRVTNRKDRKGLIKFRQESGTNAFRRHLRDQHGASYKAFQEAQQQEPPKKTRKVIHTLLATHKKYSPDSPSAQEINKNVVLLVARAGLPFSIVDNPDFKRLIYSINPRVQLPNRRSLVAKHIPEFKKAVMDDVVAPRLAKMESVTISFDLWMSRGCEDIFDLIVHGLDGTFNQTRVHLAIIQCDETRGETLSTLLLNQLEKFGIKDKVIACVKDGGSNLRACKNIIRSLTNFKHCSTIRCFSGVCFAHLISGACNSAMHASITDGLPLIDFMKVRRCL